jgi:hypothetical protein
MRGVPNSQKDPEDAGQGAREAGWMEAGWMEGIAQLKAQELLQVFKLNNFEINLVHLFSG